MSRTDSGSPMKILVATDRTPTGDRAVQFAGDMSARYGADLLVLQVLLPDVDRDGLPDDPARAQNAALELKRLTEQVAGERGEAVVVVDEQPADAIVRAAAEESADLIVVGNAGMAGRKQFLLGNVPNRVSHNAPCSVLIVDTSGARAHVEPPPPPIAPGEHEEAVAGHLLGRAARIGRVMTKHGLAELISRSGEAMTVKAARFRQALDELGPTFQKLGQVLSTRPDLIPPEFVDELSKLQERVTPMSEEEVVRVMEEELRVPWEDVFEDLDPVPMAAGTMAQVHRATLENGESVVVKVQRPNARGDILQDLGLLEMFAEKTENRPAFRQLVDIPVIVSELSNALKQELDMRREAENIERLRQVLKPYPRLDVPEVYRELSTDRLLVMEDVQGVAVTLAPEGTARKEAARELLECYYRQILTDGFFHADPHPGNLRWWNDKIYFLDCGLVGEIGPEVRELLLMILMAFWQHDSEFLSEVVLMLAGEDQRSDIDLEAFQSEIGSLVDRYRHVPVKELQLGPLLQEITELSMRYDVRLPGSLVLTGKALAQVQVSVGELDPTLDLFQVAGSFVGKNLTERLRDRANPQRLFYEGQKLRLRLVRLLESFERLTGARPGPKLQVHFRGTEGLERSIRRAGRRVALAAAAGGALVGTAITASADVAGWVPGVLGGAGGALTLGLVVDLLRRGR